MSLEPRLNAWRPDLADIRLKGKAEAARFVAGMPRQVVAFAAPLKRTPRSDAGLDTEILRGETFTVFEDRDDGWSWGQLETDSYVGYVPTDSLSATAPPVTHGVTALRTFIYPGPDMKLPALGALSLGAGVTVDDEAETRGTRYVRLAGGEGWLVAQHVNPLAAMPRVADYVVTAERFLNLAYLWGGRTSLGLDCSSLVQLSLATAGIGAPRDTDLQERLLGTPVSGGVEGALRRGDLVYWKGHVAILLDGERMIHASGHHMSVVIEPLRPAVARIATTAGPPTAVKRPVG
jgi:cell wall-associated NlpC family hydrolase